MGVLDFSETNLVNSLSLELAGMLLGAGYVLYWHRIDAVQTPDGWYYGYSTNQASHLQDATYAARLAASRGLITLRGKTTAIREYPVRPTSDGTVPTTQDELPIPVLTVEVGPMINGMLEGMGSRVRHRYRHLVIYGIARDEHEQAWLQEHLAAWFDQGEVFDIRRHDDESLAMVGSVETQMVQAESAINVLAAGGHTYEVVLNAQLEYFA